MQKNSKVRWVIWKKLSLQIIHFYMILGLFDLFFVVFQENELLKKELDEAKIFAANAGKATDSESRFHIFVNLYSCKFL